MKRPAFIIVLTLFFALLPFCAVAKDNIANDVQLGNTDVAMSGTVIKITYDLDLGKNVRNCVVELQISKDGGKTFRPITGCNAYGDVGKINKSGRKTINCDVSAIKYELAGKELAFRVNVKSKDVVKTNVFLLANLGVPIAQSPTCLDYGARIGVVRKIGGYLSFRMNSKPKGSIYEPNDINMVWATGNKGLTNTLFITGGMLFRASKNFYPYFGAGYGSRTSYWQTVGGDWAKIKENSSKGLAAEAGFCLKFSVVSLSLGISTLNFKYGYLNIGAGVAF